MRSQAGSTTQSERATSAADASATAAGRSASESSSTTSINSCSAKLVWVSPRGDTEHRRAGRIRGPAPRSLRGDRSASGRRWISTTSRITPGALRLRAQSTRVHRRRPSPLRRTSRRVSRRGRASAQGVVATQRQAARRPLGDGRDRRQPSSVHAPAQPTRNGIAPAMPLAQRRLDRVGACVLR